MKERTACRPLLALAAVVIFLWPRAESQAQWHSHYFKERRSLTADTGRIAIFPGAGAGRAAAAAGLSRIGLDPAATRAHGMPGWHLSDIPSAGRSAAGVADLVRQVAADGSFEFVSPVFLDRFGGPLIVTPDILVGFEDGVSEADAEAVLAEAGAGAIRERRFGRMKGAYKCRPATRSGLDVLAIANRLAERPEVKFAEPDMIFSGRSEWIPNDTYFGDLWGIHNTGQSGGTPDRDMDGPEAWDLATGSPAILVMVIDTGVQQNHPDINQLAGADFTSAPGVNGGPVNECDRHGTAVAGCVSAIINNSVGVVGIAPGCRVVSARTFVSNVPCTGGWTAQYSWTVDALAWGEAQGVRVSNNSNYYGSESSAVTQKYADTKANGMVHFASAGNDASSTLSYPARLSSVNAVAALSRSGALASFSNYGAGLDFSAPGDDIYSTDRTGNDGYSIGDYAWVDGTSFASPYAAGVAAAILSVSNGLSAAQVEQVMQGSCVDLGAAGYDTTYGWGFVNARAALDLLSECAVPDPPTGPVPADQQTVFALPTVLDWSDATGATSYDVYFGTSPSLGAPDLKANVGTSQWTISPAVVRGATYYWKIGARNNCGTNLGSVWSFSTCPSPASPVSPVAAPGSPVVTAAPPLQNNAGDRFDLNTAGAAAVTINPCGFGSFGNLYVNFDAQKLYIGATNCDLVGDNNAMIVFLGLNTLTDDAGNLWNKNGAPLALDQLHNVAFSPPVDIAIVLGDEYGDGTWPGFQLGNGYAMGQGVFYLSPDFWPLTNAVLSQFDGTGTNATATTDDDGNRLTDRWEVAIPWGDLNAAGMASVTNFYIAGLLVSDGTQGVDRYISGNYLGASATCASGLDSYNNFAFGFVTLTGLAVHATVRLTISGSPSQHGSPAPLGYGVHTVPARTVVTNSVASAADESGGTRYVNNGWTGAGSVPASGTSNKVVFMLDQDSDLTWMWQTQHALFQGASGAAAFNSSTTWLNSGVVTQTVAAPEVVADSTTNRFVEWRLDGIRQPDATSRSVNPATGIVMSGGRIGEAVYLPAGQDTDADGLMDWFEQRNFGVNDATPSADPDGDDADNHHEQQSGTDPTVSNSAFRIDRIVTIAGPTNFAITVRTEPGKKYTILFTDHALSNGVAWSAFANSANGVGTWIESGTTASTVTFTDDFTSATSGGPPMGDSRSYKARVDAP